MSEAGPGHNGQLKSIVERIENVNEQIKEMTSDRADIFAEAKSSGLDVKALRTIVKLRAMKPDDVAAQEEILNTYKQALGMLA